MLFPNSLFGAVSFSGFDAVAQSGNSGIHFDNFTFVFLGGTGLFAGAFGLGFSNGENRYENNRFLTGSSGTGFRRLDFSITTPLPAGLPLLLSGLGLLGARKAAAARSAGRSRMWKAPPDSQRI